MFRWRQDAFLPFSVNYRVAGLRDSPLVPLESMKFHNKEFHLITFDNFFLKSYIAVKIIKTQAYKLFNSYKVYSEYQVF